MFKNTKRISRLIFNHYLKKNMSFMASDLVVTVVTKVISANKKCNKLPVIFKIYSRFSFHSFH